MNELGSLQIQGLVEQYLKRRSVKLESNNDNHLDEDILSAFVEGRLTKRETAPITKHIVDCSYCRHITAEIVKLNVEFEGVEVVAIKTEPTKVSDVLSAVISKLFSSSESAVFAHQAPEEDNEEVSGNGQESIDSPQDVEK